MFGTAADKSPGKVVTGAIHETDAAATQAQNDALVAANFPGGLALTSNLSGEDLSGLTLTPGVHLFSSSAQLTGPLTLDAQGGPNVDFVFRLGKTLTTRPNSTASLINGGPGDGVHPDVGSSATLGTGTSLAGKTLSNQSIGLDAAAQILCDRAIATNAAVTMNANLVADDCTGTDSEGGGPIDLGSLGDLGSLSDFGSPDDSGSPGFSGRPNGDGQSRDVPEPSTGLLLLAVGLIGVGARMTATSRASFESV